MLAPVPAVELGEAPMPSDDEAARRSHRGHTLKRRATFHLISSCFRRNALEQCAIQLDAVARQLVAIAARIG
jgi:hypothetical protein